MKWLFYLIALIVILLNSYIFADWTDPVRISYGMHLLDPRIVTVGETLIVVGDGGPDSYYYRSSDNGRNWTGPFNIPDSICIGVPDILISGGKLHMAWSGTRIGNCVQLYHAISTDYGITWNNIQRVYNNRNINGVRYARLAGEGDTLFVLCVTDSLLFSFTSFNGGITWQDSALVECGPFAFSYFPTLIFRQGRLHIIY
jgi:hypothetical protein